MSAFSEASERLRAAQEEYKIAESALAQARAKLTSAERERETEFKELLDRSRVRVKEVVVKRGKSSDE